MNTLSFRDVRRGEAKMDRSRKESEPYPSSMFRQSWCPFTFILANCEFVHNQPFTWVQQPTCIRGLEDTHIPDLVIDTRARYVKEQPLDSMT